MTKAVFANHLNFLFACGTVPVNSKLCLNRFTQHFTPERFSFQGEMTKFDVCVMEARSNKPNAYKYIGKTALRNVEKNDSVGLDLYCFPAP